MHTQTRGSTNTQIQRPNALAVMLWSSRADGPIAQPFFVFFLFYIFVRNESTVSPLSDI